MKTFKPFGMAAGNYSSLGEAAINTYQDAEGKMPPTPLAFPDNPFSAECLAAKNIFEIGSGVGRNIPWVMEHTQADYWSVEPNETMRKYVWDFNDRKYYDRVMLYPNFIPIPPITFDVVLSTFVFQHIGYMPSDEIDNVTDITNHIRKFTHKGTIWILIEHDSEDKTWINRWFKEQNITPDVYIRGFKGIPEITARDSCAPNGGHHLIIWKET
jgi:cyclopropane fatty-acyl-phospholipid synthase-like methyltransferase